MYDRQKERRGPHVAVSTIDMIIQLNKTLRLRHTLENNVWSLLFLNASVKKNHSYVMIFHVQMLGTCFGQEGELCKIHIILITFKCLVRCFSELIQFR